MQSTHVQERTRTVTAHLASSLVSAHSQTRYEECPFVLQWELDGTFSPEDTPPIKGPTPSTAPCADELDPNSGIRMSSTSALDRHVRATSEHTQTSHRPATITQNPSDSSFPDSQKSSARSSVSSFARRIMRAGPDLRLINADKTDLVEKFSPGGGRRSTIASLRKVMTYEDPSKASEISPANPPAVAAPEPKPTANRSHWFKALRKHDSEPERPVESTTVSPMITPNASMQQLHFHSKSDGFAARSNVSTDDSHSEYASSVEGTPKASAERQGKGPSRGSPQKASRPIFAHLRSHSSHLLKSSKPQSPLPIRTQPKSAAQTPVSTSDGSPSTLSQKKDSKRSIKRRLWRGPLSPGDIRSIANVISPVKMMVEKPDAEPIKGDQVNNIHVFRLIPAQSSIQMLLLHRNYPLLKGILDLDPLMSRAEGKNELFIRSRSPRTISTRLRFSPQTLSITAEKVTLIFPSVDIQLHLHTQNITVPTSSELPLEEFHRQRPLKVRRHSGRGDKPISFKQPRVKMTSAEDQRSQSLFPQAKSASTHHRTSALTAPPPARMPASSSPGHRQKIENRPGEPRVRVQLRHTTQPPVAACGTATRCS